MTGTPVDDRSYLAQMVSRCIGDELVDTGYEDLAYNFFAILHPDMRPGDIMVRSLRKVVEMCVHAVDTERSTRG